MLSFRRRFCRPAVVIFVVMTLWPNFVLGQDKAGIVTTLEGNVTAARPAVTQPVTLKFKDDVYLNDRITTGDRSLARMLLGGKAVVTVRERSVVTITETTNKSTIELASGKIGLAVAKERMKAGESVEIRTPNAVAAVRGTVVIAEVERTTAQAPGGGPSGLVSHFWVLKGVIDAFPLVPGTTRPSGQVYQVNAMQSFTMLGSTPPTVGAISAGQLGQITGGLTASGMQQQSGGQDSVVSQQVQTAVTLLGVINQPQIQIVKTDVVQPPIDPGGDITPEPPPSPPARPTGVVPVTVVSGPVGPGGFSPDLASLVGTANLVPTGGTPLVTVPAGTTITQPGGGNLLSVPGTGTLITDGLLLNATNSTFNTPQSTVLSIAGNVTSSAPGGVSNFDPTIVNAVAIANISGTLNTAGPLVSDVRGTFTMGGDFVTVSGTVQAPPGFPAALPALLVFDGTTVQRQPGTAGANLVNVMGTGRVTLDGLLLDATNATNLQLGTGTVLTVGAGGVVNANSPAGGVLKFDPTIVNAASIANISGTLNTAAPLVTDQGGTYNMGGDFVTVSGAVQAPPGSLSALPALLLLNGTTVQPQVGTQGVNLVAITSPGNVTVDGFVLQATGANFQLGNGTLLNVAGILTANSPVGVLKFDSTIVNAASIANISGTLNAAGSLVSDVGGTFNVTGDFINVTGTLSRTGTSSALIFLSGSTVNAGTYDTDTSLFRINGGLVTLSGPLLQGNSADVTQQGSALLKVTGGGTLQGNSTSALMSLNGGSLTLGEGVFAAYIKDAAVTLGGGLFNARGTALYTYTGGDGAVPFVRLENASLTAGSTPVLELAGLTLNLQNQPVIYSALGSVLTIGTGGGVQLTSGSRLYADALYVSDGTGNQVFVNGTVLDATNSSVTLSRIANDGGPSDGAVFNLAQNQPLFRLLNSTLTLTEVGETFVEFGTDGGPIPSLHGVGLIANGGALTLSGPLLRLGGVNMLDSDPLVQLTNVTVNQSGGHLVEVSGFLPSMVAGSLLLADGGILNTTGSLLKVKFTGLTVDDQSDGANLGIIDLRSNPVVTIGGGRPIVRLNNATVTSNLPFLSLDNTALNVTGSIFASTDSDTTLLSASVVRMRNGSSITTSGSPAFNIVGGSLSAISLIDSNFFESAVNTQGTVVNLDNTTLSLSFLGADFNATNFTSNLAFNEPFMRVQNNSSVFLFSVDEPLVRFGFFCCAPASTPGVAMIAQNSFLNLNGPAVLYFGGDSTAGMPLVLLENMNVQTQNTRSGLVAMEFGGGSGTLSSGLLEVRGGVYVLSGPLVEGRNDSTLTTLNGIPAVKLDLFDPAFSAIPVQLSGQSHVVKLDERFTLNLSGSLLSSLGAFINVANGSFNTALFGVLFGPNTAPSAVATTFGGQAVLIAQQTANLVSVMNARFAGVFLNITVPGGPTAIAADGFDGAYVVTRSTNSVTRIFFGEGVQVNAPIPVGSQPGGVAVTPNRQQVYVTNTGSNTVSVISNNVVAATIPVGTSPAGVAITPDGARALVTNAGSNNVSVINTATNQVVATVTTGIGTTPNGIAVSPDGSRAFVTNSGSNTVSVIDLKTNTVIAAAINVGSVPNAVTFDPDGNRAYVTNNGSKTISVINTSNLQIIATISIADNPNGIVITEGRGFVPSATANTVVVLDTNPGGRILSQGGTLNSDVIDPVLVFNGGTVQTGQQIVGVEGAINFGPNNLPSLVYATTAELTTGGSILFVNKGGSITDQCCPDATDSLMRFESSVVTAGGGNIVTIRGNGFPAGFASVDIRRPLVTSIDSTLSSFFNFLFIGDGGSLTVRSATAIQLEGGSWTGGSGGGGALLRMFSFWNQNPNSLALFCAELLYASDGAMLTSLNGNLVDIRNGATVLQTGPKPFMTFDRASGSAAFSFINIGQNSTIGGGSGLDGRINMTLEGSLLKVLGDIESPVTLSSGNNRSFLAIFDDVNLTTTGGMPLVNLLGIGTDSVTLAASGNAISLTTSAANNTPPVVSLSGSLLQAVDARITSGLPGTNARSTVFIGDGAVLQRTDSNGTALIDLSGADVTSAGNILTLRRSQSAAVNSRLLLGDNPLLVAFNSTLTTANPNPGNSTACCNTFFVAQGAELTSTFGGSLISLFNSTVNAGGNNVSGGNFFGVSDSGVFFTDTFHLTNLPSTVTLGGGLLYSENSTLTALFSGLNLFRSTFTAGAGSPLIEIRDDNDRTWSFGGVSPVAFGSSLAGTETFASLVLVNAGIVSGQPNRDATLTLNNRLLFVNNTETRTIFNTTGDFIAVFNGASVVGTNGDVSVISSNSAAYNVMSNTNPSAFFRFFLNVSGVGGATGTRPATMAIAGALLDSSYDIFNIAASFLNVNTGGAAASAPASLTQTAGSATLLQFNNSVVHLGAAAGGVLDQGNLLNVSPNSLVHLTGGLAFILSSNPFLSAWDTDRFVMVRCGSTFSCSGTTPVAGFETSSTDALINMVGLLGSGAIVRKAMFDLRGVNTTTETDPDAAGLIVGTDKPLRHAGTLFVGQNTNVTTGEVVRVDTALLEATLPVVNLINSTKTVQNDAINLVNRAKFTAGTISAPISSVFQLNASTLTVLNGSLANISNSFMSIVGNLFSLVNGSTLNINSGALVTVDNGGVFRLTGGSLGVFGVGGGANVLNIAATPGGGIITPIPTLGGNLPVMLLGGAQLSQVTVTPGFVAFVNGSTGSNSVNIAPGAAALVVKGTAAKVKLGP